MSPEASALVAAVLLGVIQVTLQSTASTVQFGIAYNAGPRDERRPTQGVAARLERASKNFQETFPFFAAAILLALISGRSNEWTQAGAWLYVIARIVYVPLYAAGVSHWRTWVWMLALSGLLSVLFGVALPAAA